MAEEAQAKVQTSVKNFVNEVDRNHLRKMEKEMHECAARCCSNNVASMNEVQACVEKCSEGPRRAQQMVQAELQRFQQALDRCVAGCQDKVKDSLPAEASDANVSEARGMFERCAIGCVDEQIARMPSITKKVREKLSLNVY